MFLLMIAALATTGAEGDAAFSYRIESAAEVRGVDLDGRPGCAVYDCSRLGDEAWVRVGAAWTGPYVVTDCVAAHHREFWRERDRVVDLPWSLWEAWGLPLAPYPIELRFSPPPPPLTR